ncbi:BAG family molecular chaperone regulator 1 [Armadillidium nasatum]|uniref:BAG family molecular chaperone regulator 1 n=1 Tax=Armadillidium nasatum TaxID=96803 RepID=A0A5N5SVV3_9CRUS|nr:BAG family molecular chaperone regulator 1 [Armadillidium nasatum]
MLSMADQFFITATMGTKKKKLYVDPSYTLQDLAVKIEEVFSVHRNSQKLILKGRLLSRRDVSLQSLGIKKGDMVMVLGKVIHTERDDLLEKLDKFEKKYKDEKMTIDDTCANFESTWENGKNNDQMALQSTMKKLLFSNEQLMKLLEAIDGMEMTVSCDEVRQKRRGIVRNIQELMDAVDREYKGLQSYVKPSS